MNLLYDALYLFIMMQQSMITYDNLWFPIVQGVSPQAAQQAPKRGATGSHKPHYDVLHAAMFAEGRGGTLASWPGLAGAPFGRLVNGHLVYEK